MNEAMQEVLMVLVAFAIFVALIVGRDKWREIKERREAEKYNEDIAALEESWRCNGYRGPHSEYWTDRPRD